MKRLPLNKGLVEDRLLLDSGELIEIIKVHLDGFEQFSRYVREIMQNPARFGFPETDSNG